MKSVTGYDVPKLLVGSLGTLGVIVEATLRLQPAPPASGSWRCSLASPVAAEAFLAALLASSIEPERLVLANERGRTAGAVGGAGFAVLVSVGSVEDAVAAQGRALAALGAQHGAEVAAVAESEWSRLGSGLDAPVVLKLAGLVRNTVRWLARAEELAARASVSVAGVGQAGNGVIHLGVRGAASGGDLNERLLAPLREELRPEGGSVVVERAPAELKSGLDVWGPLDPGVVDIATRLKREFDPDGILNPGRFVGGL